MCIRDRTTSSGAWPLTTSRSRPAPRSASTPLPSAPGSSRPAPTSRRSLTREKSVSPSSRPRRWNRQHCNPAGSRLLPCIPPPSCSSSSRAAPPTPRCACPAGSRCVPRARATSARAADRRAAAADRRSAALADVARARGTHLDPAGQAQRRVGGAALLELEQLGGGVHGLSRLPAGLRFCRFHRRGRLDGLTDFSLVRLLLAVGAGLELPGALGDGVDAER